MEKIIKVGFAILCFFYVIGLCNTLPTRRAFRKKLSVQLRKAARGERPALEMRLRFGVDKFRSVLAGIRNPDFGRVRLRDHGIASRFVRPQLDGSMGNNMPPRRLRNSEKFKPAEYTAPRAFNRDINAPASIQELSEEDKLEIFTAFVVKYNYTTNDLVDQRALVSRMQENYGLNVTGELDEPTVKAMLKPRCGVPDGPAQYNTFPNNARWTNKQVTYQIKGYSSDLSQCQIRNAFKRAFRVWEEVVDLTFVQVERSDDEEAADMIIYFGHGEHGDGYPFDGPNGLLAHAFTPGTDPIAGDAHFDEGEFWTLGNGQVFDTYNGNAGGEPCFFPFLFRGKSYSACTSEGRRDGLEWCATTEDYDKDGKFAFCPHERLFTFAGNAENDPCVFPFTFLGKTYDSCTYEGRSDGYEWCATTSDYDADGRWGFCPKRASGSSGGNSGGASCKFPFTFQGYVYNECTTEGRSDLLLWCSTTSDYDADGKWGFCEGDGYSLFLVAAHEFGHAIGLDHSSDSSALMYPTYAYQNNFQLPDDDKRGARFLYNGPRRSTLPTLELEKCGGQLQVTESATTTTTTSTTSSTRPGTVMPPTIPVIPPRNGKCRRDPRPREICDIPIDSITMLGDRLYIFEGEYYWFMSKNDRGKLGRPDGPHEIRGQWRQLQCNIDAVYLRGDEKLVFFKKYQYYVYDGTSIERGYPREVTELGLPAKSKVDAAVAIKASNREHPPDIRLYYIVADKVYRANYQTGIVEKGSRLTYLGDGVWDDIPRKIDAAFVDSRNTAYTIFLSDRTVHRYQNYMGRAVGTKKMKLYFKCKAKRYPLPLKGRRN